MFVLINIYYVSFNHNKFISQYLYFYVGTLNNDVMSILNCYASFKEIFKKIYFKGSFSVLIYCNIKIYSVRIYMSLCDTYILYYNVIKMVFAF